ncbi:MAG: DUF4105 domain-containing protein [Gammaproteobacteria bacterium]|nr:DUF4105 domain-containing protein [Gammaproteobacteria bacterium]MCW9005659.1 DUF4105 domain-containing protein [Gammaproteobacteria bacterium]
MASAKKLAQHPEWINLLHYEKTNWFNNDYVSQVDDERFFNAPDGKNNPASELSATISAFFRMDLNGDDHPQCKFVARLAWLKDKLPKLQTTLPEITCKEYLEWRANVPDERTTMVFPAYHLNSPSSMFGHTLLRLDPPADKQGSEWLSIAVNFGANVTDGDNSLFYAFKGLSGGYPGYFIVTPYFKKIKEYNYKEKRDIWEYPLNLTREETQRMVTHLWELKDIEFDYYFFDENCSYRLLELLEVARPGINLTKEFIATAIPVDTVRSIEDAGLITDAIYRPSQVTTLEYLLAKIPENNRHLIKLITSNPETTNNPEFTELSNFEQRQLVEIAYKYSRYLQTGTERDEASATTSYQLLEKLNTYKAKQSTATPTSTNQPEKGHYSKRITLGLGKENKINYSELGYKMSFHNLEDNENGFLQGAQINLGNIQFRSYDDESVRIQQFDVVDIFSLTPRTRLFDPLSWRIYTGTERQLTFGKDRTVAHVTGGAGVAYQPVNNNIIYTMLMARLERNSGFDKKVTPALGASLGMLHHFGRSTARVEFSGEEFNNDEYRHRGSYSHNFVISRNHSIKINAIHEKQRTINFSEFNINYQYYFF